MISRQDLRKIARARLADAQVLFSQRRYDGAYSLCGYAMELTLKARICRSLKWAGYPESRREFQGYESFRTHDFDVLLRLSGREAVIRPAYLAEWSVVIQWVPEIRYRPIGNTTQAGAALMIQATRILMGLL
jgi:HEPN domain-containing protein